jgi:hypothetical protein
MVDQPVEERVGQRGVAQCLMPVLHRQRPGDTRRPALVAIFEQLQQVPSVFITQKLRSFSHPLQRWQWDLSALEDEMLFQFPPGDALIQPFTLHH